MLRRFSITPSFMDYIEVGKIRSLTDMITHKRWSKWLMHMAVFKNC